MRATADDIAGYPKHYRAAAPLPRLYGVSLGLRTLEVLQLAVALDLPDSDGITIMVSADTRLCEAAAVCGCKAINPVNPGSLWGSHLQT